MKNLSIIAAVGDNLELGKDNQLIWPIKEDLGYFKEHTMIKGEEEGKPMLMGYKTFYSLRGRKPLPRRKHIVLTHNNNRLLQETDQIKIVRSLDEALEFIEKYKDEVMVIGGASVYSLMLEYAEKMYLTRINATQEDADAFFPEFDEEEWSIEQDGEEHYTEETGEPLTYKHLIYTRKTK